MRYVFRCVQKSEEFLVLEQLPSGSTLSVYNNWGSLVFQSVNYQNDWNGLCEVCTLKGEGLPTGTYYYLLEVPATEKIYKGFVYLAR